MTDEERIDRVVAACQNCTYWLAGDVWHTGICRRMPPAVIVQTAYVDGSRTSVTDTEWPETGATDWCGEHKP